MKNTNEMQLEKMLDCLYSAGLTEEQVEKAESYFTGESESFEIKAEEKREIDLLHRDAKDKLKKQLDRTMKVNGEPEAAIDAGENARRIIDAMSASINITTTGGAAVQLVVLKTLQ